MAQVSDTSFWHTKITHVCGTNIFSIALPALFWQRAGIRLRLNIFFNFTCVSGSLHASFQSFGHPFKALSDAYYLC